MQQQELENTLKDLPRVGRLVKDRAYRQVWRFELGGRPFYLKFFPAGGVRDGLRRLVRGSPARLEFQRLQLLQKAKVPSPRAVALLMGFRIGERKGDAVLLQGLEPSVQLDKHFNAMELQGKDAPNHLQITKQVIDLLEVLGRAGLGHSDLHLGNLLMKEGQVHLLDGYAVHRGGLRMRDILLLGLSARPYATKTDLLRAWKRLGPDGRPPAANRRGPAVWKSLLERAFKNDRYFGHLDHEAWSGHFFKHAKFPHRWSHVSRMDIGENDWSSAFPLLLQMIESDQFEVLKRTASGEVLAGEVILGGRPIQVVIKRPFRKYWHRWISEIGRGTRPRRAWSKAWKLVIRGIPTAWPMLMMERRIAGYATDALIVYERVQGRTLEDVHWAERGEEAYRGLLFRVGRLLRRLEQSGLYLYDAKTTNWMVYDDPELGPTPMIIDVDGVRTIRQSSGGFPRLLRSLREGEDSFAEDDARALVQGYAPYARPEEVERLLAERGPVREDSASRASSRSALPEARG